MTHREILGSKRLELDLDGFQSDRSALAKATTLARFLGGWLLDGGGLVGALLGGRLVDPLGSLLVGALLGGRLLADPLGSLLVGALLGSRLLADPLGSLLLHDCLLDDASFLARCSLARDPHFLRLSVKPLACIESTSDISNRLRKWHVRHLEQTEEMMWSRFLSTI